MEVEATLTVNVTGDEQATLSIDSPNARHLVGRQGSNLRAINALLNAALEKDYDNWNIRIDVQGGERRSVGTMIGESVGVEMTVENAEVEMTVGTIAMESVVQIETSKS